jgi:hypothetical protein
MYVCPVCVYAALEFPLGDFTICPNCGTEFGSHDSNKGSVELGAERAERGLLWSSRVIERPAGRDRLSQLQSAGLILAQEVPVQSDWS